MENVKIDGLILDVPDIENIKKWDYGIEKSEGKNKVLYLWLDEYIYDFKKCSYEICSHKLSKTSRGTIFLDDRKITEQKEGLRIFEVFGKLYQNLK